MPELISVEVILRKFGYFVYRAFSPLFRLPLILSIYFLLNRQVVSWLLKVRENVGRAERIGSYDNEVSFPTKHYGNGSKARQRGWVLFRVMAYLV